MKTKSQGRLSALDHYRSLAFRSLLCLFLLGSGAANVKAQHPGSESPAALDPSVIVYVSNYKDANVQRFSSSGASLGIFCNVLSTTGLAFDQAGNLFVASADLSGNSIQKFAPNGSGSIFTTTGLTAPHALAFDGAGNLFVANTFNGTIQKFTPDGVGTVFADSRMGVAHPTDLKFDAAGDLWVTNAFGGPTGKGSVQKFAPDGTATVFADSGFNTAYGIAFDSAGNVYVSNLTGDNVLKFAPDGTNLGVFASAPLNSPHGMFFDSDGILYVANSAAATIEKFSPTGAYLGVFAITGAGPHFFALTAPAATPTPTPSPTPSPPVITTQPKNQVVSLGQTATFTVKATGAAPLLYQWQKNAADIAGATLSRYTTPPATASDNGSLFRVIVSNAGGSVTSDQKTLTVNLPPTISAQPRDKTVNVGQTAKFTVTAAGTKPLSYQWMKNGAPIAGATLASYTTPPAAVGDNGALFSVVVTNPYGSATSSGAKLTVN